MKLDNLEDEIKAYFLRKSAVKTSDAQQHKLTFQNNCSVVPLLMKDILTVNISNNGFLTAFQGLLQFKQCIIYGRIISSDVNGAQYTTYLVDDSTACVHVTVFKKNKRTKNVKRLKRKVDSDKRRKLKEPMGRIVCVTEKLLDIFQLLPGTRILVVGRLELYRGRVALISDSFFVDEGHGRELEIAFKDSLINYYIQQCSKRIKI